MYIPFINGEYIRNKGVYSMRNVKNFKSALVCAMVGDSFGWVTEFSENPWFKKNVELPVKGLMDWKRQTGGRWYRHSEIVHKGEYSDDTQLILATLRSLKYNNWFEYLAFVEFPLWTLYARGAGRACKAQAETLSKGKYPWKVDGDKLQKYFESGGDGGAMRILPHLFKYADDREQLLETSLKNTLLTHGHENSMLGSLLYMDALYCVCNEVSKEDLIDTLLSNLHEYPSIIEKVVRETIGYIEFNRVSVLMDNMINKLEFIRKHLESSTEQVIKELCINLGSRGAAIDNAVASIYLYLKYDNPYQAIFDASNTMYCDTDTLASMSGALLGLDRTVEELPEWFTSVADYEVAMEMVDELADAESTNLFDRCVATKLKERIFNVNIGDSIAISGLGEIRVCEENLLEALVKNIKVSSRTIRINNGQKIYVKKISKA